MAELDERVAAIEGHECVVEEKLKTLQTTVDDARDERRSDHTTLVTKLDAFMLDQTGRVTVVEQSTKSAHHRINWIYGLMAALILAGAAFVFAP